MSRLRQDQALIAIDGGGSTCRLALCRDGQVTRVTAGHANMHTDREGALAEIAGGLAALSAAAGLDTADLRAIPAYAGLAGVLDAAAGATIAARLPFDQIRVEDDRQAAVTGALGRRDGYVAGIGTGSFLARKTGEKIRLAGGHGLALGDEASGAWLGRELLRACLHVLDGFAETTPLLEDALVRFDRSRAAIIAFSGTATPGDYGGFAPSVVAAAEAGDSAGLALMRRGADYLARALAALGHQPGAAVCLTGGLGSRYRTFLPDSLRADVTAPAGTPLDGALALARRFRLDLLKGHS
ncbi:BadF/BadG/BcrA/BcrD ATPase family protein [Salipiger abyssi]|uniref:BadF/BadG/BcrA/BcrD ATPase family protein n=1 Tax=Salipiger abyssi TaxID=1250539 RepID=UPI001A8E8522|nr:BadF/BadG/BcrA/BcrD ATPase family protein [Salipiger abyssi]MBN9888684.1 ATPase [Salipiger abyssi]